jgi:CubicO group peptidase (beta-lactamase class C family)
MTKLMTAVAALQCVEDGLATLDEDVSENLPSIGKYGIMTGFDDAKNEATTIPNHTPITLRYDRRKLLVRRLADRYSMLLSHTSGHEYDWMNPMIMKWRASRGETPWCGPTVEEKSTVPLVYEPGTSWAYSHGSDWVSELCRTCFYPRMLTLTC